MPNRIITDGAGKELSARLDNVIAELNGKDTVDVSSSDYAGKGILSEETGREIAGKLALIASALAEYAAPKTKAALTVGAKSFDGSEAVNAGCRSWYGTCSSTASTAAKAVTCPDFVLETGARVTVYFTYTNTAGSPTLNVNGTGAIAIRNSNGAAGTLAYRWYAYQMVDFIYNGTYWLLQQPVVATTTYYGASKVSSATLNGSANAAPSWYAPTSAGVKGYVLTSNGSGAPSWVALSTITTDYELPEATTTVLGGVMLGSNTVQSVAANAVTATASRTYAVQKNSDGQLVVNVPWTSYSTATTTVSGVVMLGSDTVQTVAANAVTATTSRTYAVQKNSSGQLVVNVPWTNTTYTVATTTANGLQSYTDKAKQNRQTSVTVTIAASSWSNLSYTASVSNATASNDLVIVPSDESAAAFVNCGIKASAQAAGSVTFTCTTKPTASVTLKVIGLN